MASKLQQINAVELKQIEKELQFLVDGKVDKIYINDKKDILINIHKTQVGKVSIRAVLPNVIYVTNKKFESPTTPPGYCTFLRKYLNNSRLRAIKMVGSERILDFYFETKDAKYHLFFEFFDKGNAILTDENLIIRSPLENQVWKERIIRGGLKYEFPQKEFDLFNLNFDIFSKILTENFTKKNEIQKVLASMGLGKDYSSQILKRAKIDFKKITLNDKEQKDLFNSLNKFLKEDANVFVFKNKVYVNQVPALDLQAAEKFETFSGALDYLIKPILKKKENKNEKKIQKIEKIISAQTKRKEQLEKESTENQKKGELIYENYSLIKDILDNVLLAQKKFSAAQITDKLKDHKIVKEIDFSNSTIIIELDM